MVVNVAKMTDLEVVDNVVKMTDLWLWLMW